MRSILDLLFGCHISDVNFIFGGKSGYSCDHAGHDNVVIKVDSTCQHLRALKNSCDNSECIRTSGNDSRAFKKAPSYNVSAGLRVSDRVKKICREE
jgi:hypothetical protein